MILYTNIEGYWCPRGDVMIYEVFFFFPIITGGTFWRSTRRRGWETSGEFAGSWCSASFSFSPSCTSASGRAWRLLGRWHIHNKEDSLCILYTLISSFHRLSVSLSLIELFSSTPGRVGDRHVALHRAFHPPDPRRHSAGSLERCGVLPEASVGEAAGDQCEL